MLSVIWWQALGLIQCFLHIVNERYADNISLSQSQIGSLSISISKPLVFIRLLASPRDRLCIQRVALQNAALNASCFWKFNFLSTLFVELLKLIIKGRRIATITFDGSRHIKYFAILLILLRSFTRNALLPVLNNFLCMIKSGYARHSFLVERRTLLGLKCFLAGIMLAISSVSTLAPFC